jgi:hypothetical protein
MCSGCCNVGCSAHSVDVAVVAAAAVALWGVAGPTQAHEPNVVQGRTQDGQYILLGTMNAHTVAPPAGIINCSHNNEQSDGRMLEQQRGSLDPLPPPKDTYAWIASSPAEMAKSKPFMVVNSTQWDADPGVHHTNRTAVSTLAHSILVQHSALDF